MSVSGVNSFGELKLVKIEELKWETLFNLISFGFYYKAICQNAGKSLLV